MNRISAYFGLAMGILMVIVWIVYLITGQYDFVTKPLEAVSLLAAEIVTALSLIFAGVVVLSRRSWGVPVHLASLGMMLYTSIYSIGVFAQERVFPASVFFIVLTGFTIFFIAQWAVHPSQATTYPAGQLGA